MFSLIIIFLLITLAGFVIVRTITKEQNLFILFPVSQIVGSVFYIFLLNIVSKIFHGYIGILISTAILIAIPAFIYLKYKSGWIQLNPLENLNKLLFLLIIFVTLGLASLKMFTMLPAADSTIQWAYAASFARGNHPLMTPWQPDLAPNYHFGAYFLEGALSSLTNSSFVLIHTIFNIFLLWAGSLMILFLIWKKEEPFSKIWATIAVLIFFVAFGVIIVALPNFSPNTHPLELSQLKSAIPAKGEAEASLVDLNSLSFLPARSLSLALALVILYFMKTPFKRNSLKIFTISLLLSITAFVEESMFIPIILVVISFFILSFLSFIPKIAYIANYRKFLLFIIVLTTFIAIFQGGFLTDNIFRISREKSAFKIINPFSDYFYVERGKIAIKLFTDLPLKSNLPFLGFLVPSPLWFILILLFYSYMKKDSVILSIAVFAVISFMLFLGTEYQYCSGCSIRFHSFGRIALGFGIIYIIAKLLKDSSSKKNLLVLFSFTVVVLIPTITPDILHQKEIIQQGIKGKYSDIILTYYGSPKEDILKWAKNNIPINERFIVMDNEFPSPAGSQGFHFNGLYTILGPQYTRVIRQEPGPEFYDLALTLNPSLFIKTQTNYVYVESDSTAYKQLPKSRKNDLNNSNFFQVLKELKINDLSFKILKVLPLYLDPQMGGKEIKEGRLDQLRTLIPKKATVYLGDYGQPPEFLNFWYRMPLAYIFSDGDQNLVMNVSQTTYMVIEKNIKKTQFKEGSKYDYYILPPTQKPDFEAELIWSNIFASAWKRNK